MQFDVLNGFFPPLGDEIVEKLLELGGPRSVAGGSVRGFEGGFEPSVGDLDDDRG